MGSSPEGQGLEDLRGRPSLPLNPFQQRVLSLSQGDGTLGYGEFQRALDETEDADMTLADWNDVMTLAEEQRVRWQVQYLFSPALAPDATASDELRHWKALYDKCFEVLVEHRSHLRDNLDDGLRLQLLRRSAERSQAERGFTRPWWVLVATIARFLSRLGLKSVGLRLMTMAIYPRGTVGRATGD